MAEVLLLWAGALAIVFVFGYLAACAGAERWLTWREWWGTHG